MTPKMQQSIHLLQLSTLELTNLLQKELVENPLLEEAPSMEIPMEDNAGDNSRENQEASKEAANEDLSLGKIEFDDNWEDYFADASDVGEETISTGSVRESGNEVTEMPLVQAENLKEHLRRQLEISTDNEMDEAIGSLIIENLDDDGYLQMSVEQMAEMTGTEPKQVEKVLDIVQTFDPAGVGARNLAECLEIQYMFYELDDPLILEMVRYHMEDLERKRFSKLSRLLGVPEKRVQEVADEIGRLEPKPGRKFGVVRNEYIEPDVFVEKLDGAYQVRVNDDSAPPLRISRRYRQMLQERDNLPSETYEFIKNKYKSAMWLIRNIEQRKRTLYNVTAKIVEMQHDFMEYGISHLKPMRLRDVADEIGVHEATVCRVVNGKYVQTPRGLYELKYFFSTGLEGADGEDQSAKSVMEMIRGIIEQENVRKPYSDQKIADMLKKQGVNIARRTVSKYREKMGILSTSARKRVG
jgi:RNA polymerase sigma-54 factor